MRLAFVKLTSGRYFIRDRLPERTILHHSAVSLGLGYWHVAGASLCPFTPTSASFGGLFLHTVFCGGLSEKSLKASLRGAPSARTPSTWCRCGHLQQGLSLFLFLFLVPCPWLSPCFWYWGLNRTKPGAGTSGMGWTPSLGQEDGSEEGSELMPGRWPCWKGWGKAREKPQWGERPGAPEMGPLLLVPGFESP